MNDETDATSSPTTDIAEGSPPITPAEKEHTDLDIRADEPTAMEVFFAWEILRLPYNAALVLVALLRVWFGGEMGLETLMPGALIANVGFCVGPVAEGYLAWWKVPRKMARLILFCFGLLYAIGATINVRGQQIGAILH